MYTPQTFSFAGATLDRRYDPLTTVNASEDNGFFGPQLPGHFDFTLLFEWTVLSLLPSALFILISPIRIYHLAQKPTCLRPGLLLWAKLAVAANLLGVTLANIALVAPSPALRSSSSIAVASLACVDRLCIIALIIAEHRHSAQPSTLLSIYLSMNVLLDIVKSHSLLGRTGLHQFGALSVTATIMTFILVILEEMSKRSLIRQADLRLSLGKEAMSGFWNRLLFLWLNPTLFLGFQKPISVEDLEDMGPDFESERLSANFQPRWAKANKEFRYCLAKTCLHTLIRPFLAIALPRLCYTGIKFAQPFLIQKIVNAVGQPDLPREHIGGLIGATALVYFSMAVTHAFYTHLTYRVITMVRGALVSAMLKKSLSLDQSRTKESAAATLMSADMEGIETGLVIMNDIWASVIELGVGIYILARFVGGSSFLVVLPALVATMASFMISKRMSPSVIAWNEKIQARVAATSAVLNQVKGIKMTGLAPVASDHIQHLRTVEIQYSKKMRVLKVLIHATATFSESATPVVVMAGGLFWTKFGGGFTAAEAFATLSIIALVSEPLTLLLVALPAVAGIMGCFSRIQAFLLLEEKIDQRVIVGCSTSLNNDSMDIDGSIELQHLSKDHPNAVEMLNTSIAAGDEAEPILKGVNMAVLQSSLAMIVGPVGCGKSTLLKAMMGEATLKKGAIRVAHSSVAYCDQTSWLQNVTIRDNIVGQSTYDAEWYDTAVRACLLQDDLQKLVHGDQTLAGSGGSNLSGGQKQRVALARAVYSRRPILVLDDVFSALDRRTSQAIFANLLGVDGLLRRSGATVILATHSLEYLASADKVFVLEDGGVNERDHKSVDNIEKIGDAHDETKEEHGESASEAAVIAEDMAAQASTSEKNPKERQLSDWSLYPYYLKSIGLGLFFLWLCTVAIAAVANKSPQIYMRIWLEKDPSNNSYFVGYAVLGVTTFACASFMLAFYTIGLVPRSAQHLHKLLLDSVMSATLWFLASTDSGSLLNRFSQDMTLVSQVLPMHFGQFAYLAAMTLTDLGIIISGARYTAAVLPVIALLLYGLQEYYLRTSRQMRMLDLNAKAPLYTQLVEMASGLQHIRAFGWQESFLRHSLRLLDYSQKPFYYMFCVQRWLTLVLDLMVLLMAVVLVAFALNFEHRTSQAATGLALVNVVGFSGTLASLMNVWIELETSLGAIARLRLFVKDTPAETDEEPPTALPQNWPSKGEVEFHAVSARYNATEKPVLKSLTTRIPPGSKVGIIGRTGSGKSSLLLSLLRMLEYSGHILIDGIHISRIPHAQLRSRITTLSQDPIELPGSIRVNLSAPLDEPIDDAALIQALTRVDLWSHISSRGGLDAELSSLSLSHGQKQLLCLARALLHHSRTGAKLVLVDEATSNVDRETEARMQDVMADAFAGCTMLVVAHRLDTVRSADMILELHGGSLVHA